MRKYSIIKLGFIGVFLSMFFVLYVVFPSFAYADNISVIVNNSNSVSGASDEELSDFFMKKRKLWPNGSTAYPIERNEGSVERELFLRKILRKSSREMAMYWIERKQIAGDSAPQKVVSDDMVIRFVGAMDGAVGYVSTSSINNDNSKQVRVLKIVQE